MQPVADSECYPSLDILRGLALFGAGVALQAGRAAKQSPGRFLARRFLVLMAIGLVHLSLIWNGDILTLYAVCGILLIPLLRVALATPPACWPEYSAADSRVSR